MERLAIAAAAAAAGYFLVGPALRLIKKKTTSIEVVYFNIPGLGEPIRLLLAHCGVPFTDTRFKERSEFLARKPLLKYGQVPCLIVNGKEFFQSYTIMRYIATSFDETGQLYPSSPMLAAECDGILDQIKDMMQGWGPLRYRERFGFPAELFPDDIAAKCQKNYLTEVLPCPRLSHPCFVSSMRADHIVVS
jgi:glutathione S-transferase